MARLSAKQNRCKTEAAGGKLRARDKHTPQLGWAARKITEIAALLVTTTRLRSGCECHPVLAPGAQTLRCIYMADGSIASRRERPSALTVEICGFPGLKIETWGNESSSP